MTHDGAESHPRGRGTSARGSSPAQGGSGPGASVESRAEERADDHRKRPEEIVNEVEDAGLSFPEGTSPLAAALRHPVVVGALLALFSGIFASLLIPSLTRVWQDRPRELALKRDLVARISREATAAADGAVAGLEVERGRRAVFYDRLSKRWRLESSVIGSELTTYFPNSRAPRKWGDYMGTVSFLLQSVAFRGEEAAGDSLIRQHFRAVRFDDPVTERIRTRFVYGREGVEGAITQVNVLLLEERDQITAEVVASEAAGFSHGFWILR